MSDKIKTKVLIINDGSTYGSKEIIEKRLKEYNPVLPEVTGGYQKLYVDHVMQADKGADLDFLVGRRGSVVKRHSH